MAEKISMPEVYETIDKNQERLRRYVSLLIKANEKARLTGPSDEESLWNGHIVDCAFSLPLLPERGRVIDVGTGGGLPGIVWAICRPDLQVTLLDSITRKCALVDKIASTMGLANVSVICSRSEDYAKEQFEKFDAAAARAVCAAGMLAEYLTPFVRKKGRLLALKGPRIHEELEETGGRWDLLGLSQPRLVPYELGDMQRFVVLWEKKSPTPKGLPRRPGMAEKFPLLKKEKGRPAALKA
ncbi:MAG: 16S rRNA (guanine(527)-N(7))-methyltransferase RsmG [Synergistaceae bacterium]|nr:16S rRNA (guanine(527)-N(7))-methyltransferase RsmG [Synergistaceae bacterium]